MVEIHLVQCLRSCDVLTPKLISASPAESIINALPHPLKAQLTHRHFAYAIILTFIAFTHVFVCGTRCYYLTTSLIGSYFINYS